MSELNSSTYFLLDSQQGLNAEDGWRKQQVEGLEITPTGLQLASIPSPPVPLKDDRGDFGGLSDPTGVAVDMQGNIYIADAAHHQIFRLTRRDKLAVWAKYFRVDRGRFASHTFVYVATAQRLEVWQPSRQAYPQNFSDVEVIRERVFDDVRAIHLIICYIQDSNLAREDDDCQECGEQESFPIDSDLLEQITISKTWEAAYPAHLPAGNVCKSSIEPLLCMGGLGRRSRQFNEPHGLAISKPGDLYVADTNNHRIQVFGLANLGLKAIWGKRGGTPGNKPGEFDRPWDVAVDEGGNIWIADTNNHRLQKFDRHQQKFAIIDGTKLTAHFFQVLYGSNKGDRFVFIPARKRLEKWSLSLGRNPANLNEAIELNNNIHTLEAARKFVLETIQARKAVDILVEWEKEYLLETDAENFDLPTHLAIDLHGHIYIVDRSKDYIKVLDAHGRVINKITYTSDVIGSFSPTAIAIDAQGKLVLAHSGNLHHYDLNTGGQYRGCCKIEKGHCHSMATDPSGDLIAVGGDLGVAQIPPATKFKKTGTYFSRSLDSNIYKCQWHKILLDIAAIPTGTSIKVWTYTFEEDLPASDIAALQAEDWHTGQLISVLKKSTSISSSPSAILNLDRDTIEPEDLLILSPPGRFLWLKIEFVGNRTDTAMIKQIKAYFPRLSYLQYLPAVYQADPVSKDFLDRFLSIFETVLGSVETKIDRIAEYFDPDGVTDRRFLEWLAAWVDMSFYQDWSLPTRRRLLRHAPELYRQRGTPAGLKQILWLIFGVKVEILEHFRLRQWIFLNSQSSLGNRSQLWGNQIIDRLQLEENSRIGDFALVGTSDPEQDPFSLYAHRFSVFIPTAQSPPQIERQIRAVIEDQKPGHTQFTLERVESRFRVGVQSTVGMDTLVGAYPQMVLNHCSTLGYDAVLNGAPESKTGALEVGKRRVGVNTTVG
jgi:phage tail-like protein